MPISAKIYSSQSILGKGTDLPIVLIHGTGGSHLFWPSEIRRLAKFRIYALDLPGHGRSGGHGLHRISSYAEKIVEWLGEIKLHRAVFIGHSMGGAIVLTLAQKYPEFVLGLGLISTGARLRVNREIINNISNSAEFSNTISFIIAHSFSPNADDRLVELAQLRLHDTRPSVLQGDFIACDNFDMMEHLSTISAPTLVICGENDRMTPLRYSQYLADTMPNARLQVIPEAGHMVMLEKPTEVAHSLDGFLSRVSFSPGRISKGRF